MKIYIGNDHGGVQAKQAILKYLDEKGIDYVNLGTDTEDIVRYPYLRLMHCKQTIYIFQRQTITMTPLIL